jgi:hypothetical protein
MREIKRLRDEDGVTRHPLEAYLPQSAPGSQEADELDEHVPETGERNESIPWINLFQENFSNAPDDDSDDLGVMSDKDLYESTLEADELDERVSETGKRNESIPWINLFQEDFNNAPNNDSDDLEGLLLQRDLFVQRFGQLYAAMTWYGRFGNDSQDIQLPIWDHFEGLRHVAGEMCFHVEECGLGCRGPKLLSHEIRWR